MAAHTLARSGFRIVFVALALAVPLFASAGRVDLPYVWIYVALIVGMMTLGQWVVDPGLIEERTRPGPGGIDRNLGYATLPCCLVHLIVAGLDIGRYHWSDAFPTWSRGAPHPAPA